MSATISLGLLFAYVHVFKLTQNNLIQLWLRESLDIYMKLTNLVSGIVVVTILLWLFVWIQIMQDINMIGKAHQNRVNSWDYL